MTPSATVISVEEYLKTSYQPNCEYIDGLLRPKASGTSKHSKLQARLANLLSQTEYEVGVELTLQITATKVLIPDIAVDDKPFVDPYPNQPVLLCIEILSPGDRVGSMLAKCEEYHAWEVPYCWVIDPAAPLAYEYHRNGVPEQRSDTLRAGEITIAMSQLY